MEHTPANTYYGEAGFYKTRDEQERSDGKSDVPLSLSASTLPVVSSIVSNISSIYDGAVSSPSVPQSQDADVAKPLPPSNTNHTEIPRTPTSLPAAPRVEVSITTVITVTKPSTGSVIYDPARWGEHLQVVDGGSTSYIRPMPKDASFISTLLTSYMTRSGLRSSMVVYMDTQSASWGGTYHGSGGVGMSEGSLFEGLLVLLLLLSVVRTFSGRKASGGKGVDMRKRMMVK